VRQLLRLASALIPLAACIPVCLDVALDFRPQWQLVDKPDGSDDSDHFSYDDAGASPYLWNDALLGPRSDWQSAGRAALGLGVIGVVFIGLSLIFALVGMAKENFSKVPGAVSAFLCSFCFLLGAILYEGLRPSWGGDMGYNYPIGLYLAAGLMASIASMVLWSADYLGPKRADNRA